MAGKKSAEKPGQGVALRVVVELADLLQDDLLFLVQLFLPDLEIKQDILLVAKGEISETGWTAQLEEGHIPARVGIEVGSMAADLPADLISRSLSRPSEKDSMFQKMSQAVGVVRFVFGSEIEGADHMDKGEIVAFVEINLKAVI
jgi:hypothetical protein